MWNCEFIQLSRYKIRMGTLIDCAHRHSLKHGNIRSHSHGQALWILTIIGKRKKEKQPEKKTSKSILNAISFYNYITN